MFTKESISFFLTCWLVIVAMYFLFQRAEIPFMNLYLDGNVDSCGHINKKQWVRLLDVFLLGPMGLYIGYLIINGRSKEITKSLGVLIILYGISTISYNGMNYIKNSRMA